MHTHILRKKEVEALGRSRVQWVAQRALQPSTTQRSHTSVGIPKEIKDEANNLGVDDMHKRVGYHSDTKSQAAARLIHSNHVLAV